MELSNRLKAANVSFLANDNISEFLTDYELIQIKQQLTKKFEEILDILAIDYKNDPNTQGTPQRMARMYVDEVFSGRFQKMPKLTYFPNTKNLNDMLVVGPIDIRSTCSHHFAPIQGKAWVGVIPDKKVIGISKFSRLIRWFASRPQIQEELVCQIADKLEELIQPKGLAVVIKAQHTCMTWRGVKETSSNMVTSVMRGTFRDNPSARAEFMELVK